MQMMNDVSIVRPPLYKDPFAYALWYRIHIKNKNMLQIWVGDNGAGKSVSSLSMCDILDTASPISPISRFNLKINKDGTPHQDNRLIYPISDLIRLITTKKYPKGTMFLLDEVGVSMDNQQY